MKTKTKKTYPTNARILLAIEKWRREDRAEVDRRLGQMDGKIFDLPSKTDLTTIQTNVETLHAAIFDTATGETKLATKADVQPVVDLYKKLTLSAQIIGTGGKWTSRSILALAAILIALGIISGGIKGAIAAAIGWAVGNGH